MLDFTGSVRSITKEESMSIKLSLGSIEVSCDTPEEAMVMAGAANHLKPPKASDINRLMDQPIKLKIGNVEMTCENPVSAAATLVASGIVPRQKIYSREARGAQGAGPSKAWKDAEEYGKKHGITTDEARRLLAAKKKELKAKAVLDALGTGKKK
jgi:hypothetical protein